MGDVCPQGVFPSIHNLIHFLLVAQKLEIHQARLVPRKFKRKKVRKRLANCKTIRLRKWEDKHGLVFGEKFPSLFLRFERGSYLTHIVTPLFEQTADHSIRYFDLKNPLKWCELLVQKDSALFFRLGKTGNVHNRIRTAKEIFGISSFPRSLLSQSIGYEKFRTAIIRRQKKSICPPLLNSFSTNKQIYCS